MKKIFLLCLPLFVVVALMFYFQSREFSFFSMLEIFSNWSFDNGYAVLLETKEAFDNVSNSFENLSNSNSFFSALSNVGKMISNFFVGIGTLLKCVAYYLADLVVNIGNIVSYLLGV